MDSDGRYIVYDVDKHSISLFAKENNITYNDILMNAVAIITIVADTKGLSTDEIMDSIDTILDQVEHVDLTNREHTDETMNARRKNPKIQDIIDNVVYVDFGGKNNEEEPKDS